jgi:hypothetical protein
MRIFVGFMYFSASRADNFFHGRLRPVPARNKNISARPGLARGQSYGQASRP